MEYGMTIRPIEEYHGEPVYKVVFIAPNEACLTEAKQLYEDQFIFCESRLGDTPSAIVNGELINRKFNKGTGIKAICDELGCSLADTIGFGDSDNDLQMTDVVGISVCMANGSDNLKKLCDRICPAGDGGRRGKGAQNSGPDLRAASTKEEMITKNSRSIEREFLLERVISDGLPCDIPRRRSRQRGPL